jgi:hypothetical protein
MRKRLTSCRGNMENTGSALAVLYTYAYVDIALQICEVIYSTALFSSPELKAQVSFSDRLLSVVCPSV